jgi:hypothetical protein
MPSPQAGEGRINQRCGFTLQPLVFSAAFVGSAAPTKPQIPTSPVMVLPARPGGIAP